MRTLARRTATALALVVLVCGAGCAPRAHYTARFLRYQTLENGTRVAVVRPVAPDSDPEQSAFTDRTDLRPGETVRIRVTGRSWDTPQWMPEREIVDK